MIIHTYNIMKITKKKPKGVLDVKFFGTTSMGVRGQVVIPKDARDNFGCSSGDKFVVMEKMGCIILVPQALAAKLAKQMSDALIS